MVDFYGMLLLLQKWVTENIKTRSLLFKPLEYIMNAQIFNEILFQYYNFYNNLHLDFCPISTDISNSNDIFYIKHLYFELIPHLSETQHLWETKVT